MAASVLAGIEYTGLRELNAYLKKIGVTDTAIKDANNQVGQIGVDAARELMPRQRSGALNRTLKANKSKSNVTITVGNRTTVPYAYTFHAVALGKSKGGFTFYVPPYNRRGRQVGAYKAARRIVSNPFLYIAWERSKDKIVEAYVTAMTKLIETA